ncbi:MAG: glutamate-cysteine ligase family protein [Myxococcota bacterium]|nr:glutamate-cysteine ligase family protein [Myxococcota bacterium]
MSSVVDEDLTPLQEWEQLEEYFHKGSKKEQDWRVGTEHEKFGWWPDRRCPPTYEGARGIQRILEALGADTGWTAHQEQGRLLALNHGGASVTLEPSGQLELSGRPHKSLLDTAAEFDAHLEALKPISEALEVNWSGVGFMPWGTPDEMPLMPKPRYVVLEKRLRAAGKLGLHMMRQTATVQANFDYGNEADAFRKLRAALYLQPVITAIFANSPVVNGRLVNEVSFRAKVWLDVDDARCRLPDRFLRPDACFRDYIDWVMDVPMLFVHRDSQYVDMTAHTFRAFMRDGARGYTATLGDFGLHLSTLFPDVRLKQFIEVRAADMGSRAYVLGLPALHLGWLYDSIALADVLRIFDEMEPSLWHRIKHEVPIHGLRLKIPGCDMATLARDLIEVAYDGLSRREPAALHLLDPIREAVRRGTCPADQLRKEFDGTPESILRQTELI